MRFDPRKQHILVAGVLDGPDGRIRRVRFIIDPGTPHTVVDTPLMDALGYGAHLAIGKSTLWGVSGVTKGYVVRAPRIRVVGKEIRDYRIAVHDFADGLGVEALLGLDFFHGGYLGLDFVTGEITTR